MDNKMSPNEQHKVIDAIQRIYRRFTSANSIPVDQARVTAGEWELIKPFIKLPREAPVGPCGLEQALSDVFHAIGSEQQAHRLLHTQDAEGTEIANRIAQAVDTASVGPVSMTLKGLNELIKGVLELRGKSPEFSFLLMQYDFVEAQIRTLITKSEGHRCCADKSKTIMKALMRHLLLDEPIEFNYEQEYTYHLPKKVLMSQDEILSFYDALHSFYYGQPDAFINYVSGK